MRKVDWEAEKWIWKGRGGERTAKAEWQPVAGLLPL